ncbi:transposase [Alteromonas sp. ASW11-19]|uniref:Transposase n=1 Tax=Alteromonas salexigens TaxID=2982530 RepID=A0ABT2VPC7_9ALTE|nr:transposase [Alteromonas salexigens]MCU7555147.1 transposase [Alteromonas salexigens]
MPRPRKSLIDLSATPYYHCISRCVRRAFLCGQDTITGKSYEHRRKWVEDRLLFLARVFAIDVCAYAVMSNHTHVVLHVNTRHAESWTETEVLRRWHKLHKGLPCCHNFIDNRLRQSLSEAEQQTVKSCIAIYRSRLQCISWFMRLLNEPIARQANQEDECTGRFWEGRFKSQALLDESALAACMAYVDLNPVRAGIASSIKTSSHTSLRLRMANDPLQGKVLPLMQFFEHTKPSVRTTLPFAFEEYLALVEQSLPQQPSIASGARRFAEVNLLDRLGVSTELWCAWLTAIETHFGTAVSRTIAFRRLTTGELRRTG